MFALAYLIGQPTYYTCEVYSNKCSSTSAAAVITAMFVCQLCNHYGSFSFASVLSHIGSVHSHGCNFSVCCGVDGCTRTYTNYHAFRRHVVNRHGYLLDDSSTPVTFQSADPLGDQGPALALDDVDHVVDRLPSPQTQRRSSAMFVLKLKEKHKLAQTTVDDILADTEELLGRAIERLKQRVLPC